MCLACAKAGASYAFASKGLWTPCRHSVSDVEERPSSLLQPRWPLARCKVDGQLQSQGRVCQMKSLLQPLEGDGVIES